ncbi:Uu.00g110250.m01.CDS01 [Anthostomella pinea]|uniref:Uu.00g110250.m01.CDS01 n=1 Tax=Anthostomella pinea TaxID=933095 RepID=A0AAI8YGD8_9PEZI|nr:Uu.00g110250.m01.CDS01 [Anthostomella pinea]
MISLSVSDTRFSAEKASETWVSEDVDRAKELFPGGDSRASISEDPLFRPTTRYSSSVRPFIAGPSTGPVVRVTPTRIHISDPNYSNECVNLHPINFYLLTVAQNIQHCRRSQIPQGPKFFSTSGGIKHSVIMLTDPAVHRVRWKTIQYLFSPKGMEELSPRVEEVVKKGFEKLRLSYEENTPVDMNRIIKGVTVDTIMRLMFDKAFGLIRRNRHS